MAETRRRSDPQNRYRDRVAPETEEAFGLSNVPGLERPMASGPGDVLVGEDELGNQIYRTVLGTEYKVSADPDQRTTRGKVEDWMEEGMPLPSKEQVGEVVKALPGMAYDSMQATLDGTATLGEAVGWAPGMQAAGAGAKVPAGALRTGGGRNTENPKYNPLVMEGTDVLSETRTPGRKVYDAWNNMHSWDDETEEWVKLKIAVEESGGDPTDIVADFRANPNKYGNNGVQAFEDWIDKSLPPDVRGEYTDIFEQSLNPRGWGYAGNSPGGVSSVTAEFYNPIRNGLENLDFGKKGLKGETIAAFLEKRVPKARTSLLRSLDSGKGIFKPTQRYTQEEALDIIDQNFGKVYAEGANDWQDFQRMNFLENEEKDYGEIVIRQDRDVPFKPGEDGTHYGDNAMAHARFSIRDDGAGGEMLVVEELQSDLVQKGFRSELPSEATPDETMEQAATRRLADTRDTLNTNYGEPSDWGGTGEFLPPETIDKVISDVGDFMQKRLTLSKVEMDQEGLSLIDSLPIDDLSKTRLKDVYSERRRQQDTPAGALKATFGSAPYNLTNIDKMSGYLLDAYSSAVSDLTLNPKPRKGKPASPGTSLPPIDSTTEFVRPLIYSLMREAKNRGIDKVVIPNSDAFIEARKGGLVHYDPEDMKEWLKKKGYPSLSDLYDDDYIRLRDLHLEEKLRGVEGKFRDTYDKAVDKVLRELDREMGVDVNIEKTNLRGRKKVVPAGELVTPDELYEMSRNLPGKPSTTDYPSRMITINNLPEGKMRFAEGGLVPDMDNQMKFAFMNEGGMVDDGATVEPTTGNAVPPGSLKEEVADTIDAEIPVGAYVVPADVLQFYGRKFFMDMVASAEKELNGETDGQD